MSSPSIIITNSKAAAKKEEEEEDLSGILEEEFADVARRREWNRAPLRDLFPRMPNAALERVLDLCIGKGFTYNLSESRRHNALRFDSIVVAHVRHAYTDYDALWRDGGVERFEARRRGAGVAWRVLKEWCPWSESNPHLERIFQATLLRPEERDPEWDPMDIDIDDERDYEVVGSVEVAVEVAVAVADDPMDVD